MSKKALFLVIVALVVSAALLLEAHAESFEPVYVYKNKRVRANNFAASGWMGDTMAIAYSDGWPKDAYSGATCIKVSYRPEVQNKQGWVGIYWQDPPNNWGTQKSTYDLTGATKLVFAIRGEKGGEVINDLFMGGIEGRYPDSTSVAIGPIELTKKWEVYEVTMEEQDLSHVVGGFGWSTNVTANPKGCTFYLDEIRYE